LLVLIARTDAAFVRMAGATMAEGSKGFLRIHDATNASN
jgi:hypothetical protein